MYNKIKLEYILIALNLIDYIKSGKLILLTERLYSDNTKRRASFYGFRFDINKSNQ